MWRTQPIFKWLSWLLADILHSTWVHACIAKSCSILVWTSTKYVYISWSPSSFFYSISFFFKIGYRYDRMLSEMLGHLERQPLNKERRVAWLTLIGPVFDAMGLFLLAHFRRLFSLFFQWMHTDDDKTVLLVGKNVLIVN